MRIRRLLFLVAAAIAMAQSQSPPPIAITAITPVQIRVPKLAAAYLVAAGTDGQLYPVTLGPGLTLTAQSGGAIVLTAAGSSADVRNEVPQPGTAAGTWTLLRAPVAGATCWRNGLYQSPGADYTLSGMTLTSAWWIAGDTLACEYQ